MSNLSACRKFDFPRQLSKHHSQYACSFFQEKAYVNSTVFIECEKNPAFCTKKYHIFPYFMNTLLLLFATVWKCFLDIFQMLKMLSGKQFKSMNIYAISKAGYTFPWQPYCSKSCSWSPNNMKSGRNGIFTETCLKFVTRSRKVGIWRSLNKETVSSFTPFIINDFTVEIIQIYGTFVLGLSNNKVTFSYPIKMTWILTTATQTNAKKTAHSKLGIHNLRIR